MAIARGRGERHLFWLPFTDRVAEVHGTEMWRILTKSFDGVEVTDDPTYERKLIDEKAREL